MNPGSGLKQSMPSTPYHGVRRLPLPRSPRTPSCVLPDNTITVLVKPLEMGQGVYTGLPMLVAEKLEAPLKAHGEWKLIGKSLPRKDGLSKANGNDSIRG